MQVIQLLAEETPMTRLNSLTRYVEAAFVVTLSLVALAGIVRFVAQVV